MSKVKIALCQFGLKDAHSYQELENHIKEQCQIAISSGADIIVFPEILTFALLAMAGPNLIYKNLHQALVEYIAPFTPTYEALFTEMARKSGAVIVAGSHWMMDEKLGKGKGYNTAHLFFPDGRIERQKKNHLQTPDEEDWGTVTFDGLTVFETPKAKVGVMICYDSEFPEVARHLTLNGAQILLCPTAPYTVRGFYRIRHCCAARAVENQIYVASCHSAGSLTVPVDKPLTAFGRSAIFCPIDNVTMVNDGVIVEAETGDKETVVVGEVDLELLDQSRQSSEVTHLKNRRPETYKKHYKLF